MGRAISIGMVAIGALVFAPAAHATRVSMNGTGWHVTADPATDNNDFQMSHEGHDPTYCPHSPHGCFTVSDGGGYSLITGHNCFIVVFVPSVVRCKDPGGRVPVTVKTRDGNDNVAAQGVSVPRPSKIPITVKGGIGSDAVQTGPGRDRLLGGSGNDGGGVGLYAGAGKDVVHGGSGNDYEAGQAGKDIVGGPQDTGADYLNGNGSADVVDAMDGEADNGIDCGPGADTLHWDTLVDPAPTNCSP
jgi:Ca2+-binding RTX toxin-like protein